jgi:hypothetical protein
LPCEGNKTFCGLALMDMLSQELKWKTPGIYISFFVAIANHYKFRWNKNLLFYGFQSASFLEALRENLGGSLPFFSLYLASGGSCIHSLAYGSSSILKTSHIASV